MVEVSRQYEVPELGNALTEYLVADPVTATLQEELGIAATNSLPWEPIVLNVGTGSHMRRTTHDKSMAFPDRALRWLENNAAYKVSLGLNPTDNSDYAAVVVASGRNYMVIPEPVVLSLLEPQKYEISDDRHDLLEALLLHQMVHGYGDRRLGDTSDEDSDTYAGASIEEYRAEVDSGKKFQEEYGEVHGLASEIYAYSGLSPEELMRSHPNGGADNLRALYAGMIDGMVVKPAAMALVQTSFNYLTPEAPRA